MLQTVEAEIQVDGSIRLLQPLHVIRPSRALVTLLDAENAHISQKENATDVLKFLREYRLSENARPNAEEIEAQIVEARESWE